MTVAACVFWFFAVAVWEPKMLLDGAPYVPMGGWTHDGPYDTREECEQRRTATPTRAVRAGIKARYVAGACRAETYREYILLSMIVGRPSVPLPTEPPPGVRLR